MLQRCGCISTYTSANTYSCTYTFWYSYINVPVHVHIHGRVYIHRKHIATVNHAGFYDVDTDTPPTLTGQEALGPSEFCNKSGNITTGL